METTGAGEWHNLIQVKKNTTHDAERRGTLQVMQWDQSNMGHEAQILLCTISFFDSNGNQRGDKKTVGQLGASSI